MLHKGFLYLRCEDFSLRCLLLLLSTGSRCAGFSSCRTRALEHDLHCCGVQVLLPHGTWNLPRPGTKPVSLALAGRFFFTGPSWKPETNFNRGTQDLRTGRKSRNPLVVFWTPTFFLAECFIQTKICLESVPIKQISPESLWESSAYKDGNWWDQLVWIIYLGDRWEGSAWFVENCKTTIKPINSWSASSKSILKEICPEYSLEGLMLKLKLQHFGHLVGRLDSFRKDLDAGKDWRQEEKGMTEGKRVGWHHWLNGHKFEQTPGDKKDREAWHAAVHGVSESQTWLSNWKTTALCYCCALTSLYNTI